MLSREAAVELAVKLIQEDRHAIAEALLAVQAETARECAGLCDGQSDREVIRAHFGLEGK